jgi:Asp-tRNA(Asn)/Glu-tRNA(Gln) amidotransferase A subunit family amidase
MVARRVIIGLLFTAILGCSQGERVTEEHSSSQGPVREVIQGAASLAGLTYTASEADSMIDGIREQSLNYEHIRTIPLSNDVQSALLFNPLPHSFKAEREVKPFTWREPERITVPKNCDHMAFFTITELATLIKNRQITSEELTRLYLSRLKTYGPKLECVVTLTEDLALDQARKADREIAAGIYKGPLHGIPYGLKDIFSVKGYPTTWGSPIYRDRVIQYDAGVYERLRNAGAVLVAKLSMGELAWGDVWFGGKTKNPWKLTEGSSGSSAGSASALAAGLVAFSIGSETWGSIISPAGTCGVTGLRPTYGRVTRTGAMVLAPSMDKIGPICRTAEDCAIVLNAIKGADALDQTSVNQIFNYDPFFDPKRFFVGCVQADFDTMKENKAIYDSTFAVLRRLGIGSTPIKMPKQSFQDLSIILTAEAGATFDELTRTGTDDQMVRQIKDAWPNVLRLSRLIPAVEYLQANRLRFLLVKDMEMIMARVDILILPPFEGDYSLLTNLTGHPCVTIPNGFTPDGKPTSICFVGRLYKEGDLLNFAQHYQDATDFHRRRPRLD